MPYKSKSQQRFFHAAKARGEISPKTVKEFDEKTNFKTLPEKVAFWAGVGKALERLGLKKST